MGEVNVKDIELIEKTTGLIIKRIKPNFKTLGPRYGKYMKQIAALVAEFSQERIAEVEAASETVLDLGGEKITVTPADFEITSEDMPGWLVASEGKLTVALDITVTEELKAEGVARELINRIQNIRKDSGFEVTDKIRVEIEDKACVSDGIARVRRLHRIADPRRGGESRGRARRRSGRGDRCRRRAPAYRGNADIVPIYPVKFGNIGIIA